LPRIPISSQTSSFWKSFTFNGEFYRSEVPTNCDNPSCHAKINYVFVIENPISGEKIKLGPVCFQRWLSVIGCSTDYWFDEYLKRLKDLKVRLPRDVLNLQREVKMETVKKRKKDLQRIYIPEHYFKTMEEAEAWANRRRGTCLGLKTFYVVEKDVYCEKGHYRFSFAQNEISEDTYKLSQGRCFPPCNAPLVIKVLGTKRYWEIYIPKGVFIGDVEVKT